MNSNRKYELHQWLAGIFHGMLNTVSVIMDDCGRLRLINNHGSNGRMLVVLALG
jgi:hypothetical protein